MGVDFRSGSDRSVLEDLLAGFEFGNWCTVTKWRGLCNLSTYATPAIADIVFHELLYVAGVRCLFYLCLTRVYLCPITPRK